MQPYRSKGTRLDRPKCRGTSWTVQTKSRFQCFIVNEKRSSKSNRFTRSLARNISFASSSSIGRETLVSLPIFVLGTETGTVVDMINLCPIWSWNKHATLFSLYPSRSRRRRWRHEGRSVSEGQSNAVNFREWPISARLSWHAMCKQMVQPADQGWQKGHLVYQNKI